LIAYYPQLARPASRLHWTQAIAAQVFAALLTVSPSFAAENASDTPQIEALSKWHSVLPDSTVRLKYRIVKDAAKDAAKLAWELKSRHRTISRGSEPIKDDDAAEDSGLIDLKLQIPKLEKEVSLDVDLRTWIEDEDGKTLGEPHVKRLWILAPDPFVGRRDWLEDLGIVLYDPTKDTIERFEKAKIPFRLMRGLDALAATNKGLVIVGEATSFESSGPLAETLWRLARKGRDVLVLAPQHGTVFPEKKGFPSGMDNKNRTDQLRSFQLQRSEVIAQFDKRLDAQQWLSFKVSSGDFVAKINRSNWSVEVVNREKQTKNEEEAAKKDIDSEQGWAWIDLPLKKPGGRILLSSFPAIHHWESGPTPRYLFMHMLEHLRPAHKKSQVSLHKEKP
jgi:hypothetical protein